jgi:hypothetical protein
VKKKKTSGNTPRPNEIPDGVYRIISIDPGDAWAPTKELIGRLVRPRNSVHLRSDGLSFGGAFDLVYPLMRPGKPALRSVYFFSVEIEYEREV